MKIVMNSKPLLLAAMGMAWAPSVAAGAVAADFNCQNAAPSCDWDWLKGQGFYCTQRPDIGMFLCPSLCRFCWEAEVFGLAVGGFDLPLSFDEIATDAAKEISAGREPTLPSGTERVVTRILTESGISIPQPPAPAAIVAQGGEDGFGLLNNTPTGRASGDPHFQSFGGLKFDFHGGCDLVLMKNEGFANGLGLHVHIRTEISTWWSYIKSAVVQVGPDTLEVTGGSGDHYWVNEEQGEALSDDDDFVVAGYNVHFHRVNDHQRRFRIDLGNGDVISVETFKDFVRVNAKAENPEQFKGAAGMLGSYPSGALVSRDGSTVMEDKNAFGREWQVRESEPMLFHSLGDGVHHPDACDMPSDTKAKTSRRLGESTVTRQEARIACERAGVDANDLKDCIFDVLATNDKSMVGSF